ncbi:MAG: CoA pyrophosphatase [Sphingomonadaceae bacterium]
MPSPIERLRARLCDPAGPDSPVRVGPRGDWDFGAPEALPPATDPVPAAVLVPLVARPEPTLLLTLRTPHLRKHAGQVAFPGGRVDTADTDAVAAALREAQEEIGLEPSLVDILGLSDPYVTATGYHVTPVVGALPPDPTLVLNAEEVADVFEVPLAFALDPANHRLREAEWQGRLRRFYVIEWQGRAIWGATAGMLVALSRRLG